MQHTQRKPGRSLRTKVNHTEESYPMHKEKNVWTRTYASTAENQDIRLRLIPISKPSNSAPPTGDPTGINILEKDWTGMQKEKTRSLKQMTLGITPKTLNGR